MNICWRISTNPKQEKDEENHILANQSETSKRKSEEKKLKHPEKQRHITFKGTMR